MIYPVTDISMIYQLTIYYFYKDISAWYMISQICMIYLFMKFFHWYIKWDTILFTEIYQKNRWYITKYHHDISISYINFLICHDISGFWVDISWYTVFPGKMSHIMTLFILEGKIMSMGLLGVFIVLNGVNRSESNISNTWSTSATAIFHF